MGPKKSANRGRAANRQTTESPVLVSPPVRHKAAPSPRKLAAKPAMKAAKARTVVKGNQGSSKQVTFSYTKANVKSPKENATSPNGRVMSSTSWITVASSSSSSLSTPLNNLPSPSGWSPNTVHESQSAALGPRRSPRGMQAASSKPTRAEGGNGFPKTTNVPYGFKNPAALCYRNVSIHLLLQLDCFVDWLQTHSPMNCRVRNCLTCAFKSLEVDYSWPERNTWEIEADMRDFWQRCRNAGMFWERPYGFSYSDQSHEDAWEFLRALFVQMKEQAPGIKTGFERLFHLRLWENAECEKCAHRWKTTIEYPLWTVFLQPSKSSRRRQHSVSLTELLKLTMLNEDGTTELRCDRCKTIERRERPMSIGQSPEVLLIHLFRFSQIRKPREGMNVEEDYVKNEVLVDIPETLDMTSYTEDQSKLQYELVGIISHGGTLGGGHYIALCRSRDRTAWYEFDDHIVSSKSIREFVDRQKKGMTPCILAYQRTHPAVPDNKLKAYRVSEDRPANIAKPEMDHPEPAVTAMSENSDGQHFVVDLESQGVTISSNARLVVDPRTEKCSTAESRYRRRVALSGRFRIKNKLYEGTLAGEILSDPLEPPRNTSKDTAAPPQVDGPPSMRKRRLRSVSPSLAAAKRKEARKAR